MLWVKAQPLAEIKGVIKGIEFDNVLLSSAQGRDVGPHEPKTLQVSSFSTIRPCMSARICTRTSSFSMRAQIAITAMVIHIWCTLAPLTYSHWASLTLNPTSEHEVSHRYFMIAIITDVRQNYSHFTWGYLEIWMLHDYYRLCQMAHTSGPTDSWSILSLSWEMLPLSR